MLAPVDFATFTSRTGIHTSDLIRGWTDAREVVSLREIQVEALLVMPVEYLKQLLSSVTLMGNPNNRPYKDAIITTARIDPSTLSIAQTFVERKKYQLLLESFSGVLERFCITRGVAKCTAFIAFGISSRGIPAIAHYLPPIVEKHGGLFLLDGIHRNFIVMRTGTTLESIIIENVSAQYPCDPQPWSMIQVVEEKPSRDKRYFNLQPDLFRSLEGVGVDG